MYTPKREKCLENLYEKELQDFIFYDYGDLLPKTKEEFYQDIRATKCSHT